MENAIDILRDQYNAAINQEEDWGFFSALVGYIKYILETPVLKKIADEVIEKKQKGYDKLAELEEKSLQELKQAKKKLLKIIKDNNISPNSLVSRLPAILQEGFDNILDKLEAFEEGKRLSISGFKSDNLESFLFDIAVSILKQGYQPPLKEFLVSNEEYGHYYYEPDSGFITTGNENGNFVFSKTLKLRREQSRFIEKTEKFELWGVLNTLLKFQKAFFEKSQNKSLDYIYQKYGEGVRNFQEESDAVDIVFFARDLEAIIKSGLYKSINHDIHYLKKGDFKNYVSMINAYLIKELMKTNTEARPFSQKNCLKSIHLITTSLEPTSVIFLVLDERFEMPIRFAVKNKNGDPTHIKKLYNIAYLVDAPNKIVNYDKNIADGINNGLFRKTAVAKYMKTNRLNKPTLVQKSENKTLVLKNEILVKMGLVKNDVPIQYQSIYIDKTR